MPALTPGEKRRLNRADFPAFLASMARGGYRVVGPTVRDGAIVYGEIHDVEDLPIGWTERQEAGQVPGWSGERTRRCSATSWDPIAGRSTSTRPTRSYGRRPARRARSR